MKKALSVIGIILVALAVMAPGPPEKAAKLKINDNDWDVEPLFFGYDPDTGKYGYAAMLHGIEIQYGLATAGEHADFTIEVTLSGVKIDENGYDTTWSQAANVSFVKDPDAVKDADGTIAVLVDAVSWNGDDDDGYLVNKVGLSLVGPGGTTMGDTTTVDAAWTLIGGPSFNKPIMIDDNGWEYEAEQNAIVVPLLMLSSVVDNYIEQGYQVGVDVIVTRVSDGTLAGTGWGTGDIVKINDEGWDYMQIQPVLATLTSPEWNGDDDGSGIVTGRVDLFTAGGDLVYRLYFEDKPVQFIVREAPGDCPTCDTP